MQHGNVEAYPLISKSAQQFKLSSDYVILWEIWSCSSSCMMSRWASSVQEALRRCAGSVLMASSSVRSTVQKTTAHMFTQMFLLQHEQGAQQRGAYIQIWQGNKEASSVVLKGSMRTSSLIIKNEVAWVFEWLFVWSHRAAKRKTHLFSTSSSRDINFQINSGELHSTNHTHLFVCSGTWYQQYKKTG